MALAATTGWAGQQETWFARKIREEQERLFSPTSPDASEARADWLNRPIWRTLSCLVCMRHDRAHEGVAGTLETFFPSGSPPGAQEGSSAELPFLPGRLHCLLGSPRGHQLGSKKENWLVCFRASPAAEANASATFRCPGLSHRGRCASFHSPGRRRQFVSTPPPVAPRSREGRVRASTVLSFSFLPISSLLLCLCLLAGPKQEGQWTASLPFSFSCEIGLQIVGKEEVASVWRSQANLWFLSLIPFLWWAAFKDPASFSSLVQTHRTTHVYVGCMNGFPIHHTHTFPLLLLTGVNNLIYWFVGFPKWFQPEDLTMPHKQLGHFIHPGKYLGQREQSSDFFSS